LKTPLKFTLLLAMACAAATAFATGTVSLQPGTDRMGADYKSFDVTAADPQVCRQACADDAKCMSYSYVQPGVKGPAAVCFLKSKVVPAVASDCCTSGAKTVAVAIIPTSMPKPNAAPVVFDNGKPLTNAADPQQLLKAVNELKAQAAQQQAAIAKLSARVDKQQDELAETTSLLAVARNDVQALQGELAAANKANATLNQTLVGLNVSLAALQNAFTTFRTQEYAEHRHRLDSLAVVGTQRAGNGTVEMLGPPGTYWPDLNKKLRTTSRPIDEK
jgi:hypothetical protein